MSLGGILTILDDDPQLHDVVSRAESDTTTVAEPSAATLTGEDLIAPPTLRPVLAAALSQVAGRFVLAVTATAREADDLTAALGSFLPAGAVASFPGWETLPHERLSPQSDTVGRRIAVLRRLAHPAEAGQPDGPLAVVVAPARSLLQPIVAGLGDLEPVSLHEGQAYELDDLLARLVEIGYTRADLVSSRGEIAVRGGIVDVFPPTEEHPLRVEFFGDTVEEIRYFKVADQRSIGRADNGLWAPPCRELLLTPAVRDRAKELADTHPALGDVLTKLAEGIPVEGMEAFAPVLADRMNLLLDYVPRGGIVLACDPERIRARAEELVRTSQEFLEASWVNAAVGAAAPIDLGSSAFQPIARIRAAAAALDLAWWTIAPFGVTDAEAEEGGPGALPGPEGSGPGAGDHVPFRINASLSPAYRGDAARMLTDIRDWLAEDWRVVLVTEGHGPAQRLAETLRGEGIGARLQDLDDAPEPGVPYVTTARIENGFVWPAAKLALLTESDLAGHPAGLPTTRDMRRMPSRRRGGVDPLQLQAGDYVVHEQHGVGRYVEMTSRTAAGATREYLVIEYAPGRRGQPPDRLYVPTDQLDEVTKYSGGEAPTLHRLGGADWAKAKGRARKAVRQIASELIRLYSARMASPGFAFGPDTPWQRELEDAFPYVETPDQLGAIDEVKRDMERPVPMDRLICGDVGYGKTEIAVRAAFK
ncbi:MAG TPA: CarD family transcriptional regulator, partial [Streptosporangiaceae bacterium]|nr:CarD family transcriptional regulator [Streptosporangiaceae bacterium]